MTKKPTSEQKAYQKEMRTDLEAYRKILLRRKDNIERINRLFMGIVIACALCTVLSFIYFSIYNSIPYVFLCLTGGFYIWRFFHPTYEVEAEIEDVDNQRSMLILPAGTVERRAERLFKAHQIDLKRYYDQGLRHSGWIFGVGIGCIIGGFVIIGITLYVLVYLGSYVTLEEKIISAVLGGVGAILSDFIAVIYLQMFSKTVQTLSDFHNKLVTTHHLHFGNFLASKISNGKQREKTLADMALNLSKQKITV